MNDEFGGVELGFAFEGAVGWCIGRLELRPIGSS